MNFTSIIALVLQALTVRSVAFAVTVGAQHLAVTITQNAKPTGTSIFSLLQSIGAILAGQPGSFTFGVFSVSIQALQAA